MKLDKDICLGGRFNNLNVTGIKFNNMVIYPYGWVDPGVLNTYKIVITERDLIEEPYGPMYLYIQRLPYPDGINDWRIGTYINWGDGNIFEYGSPGEIPSKHHYSKEGTYILKTNWFPFLAGNNNTYNNNNRTLERGIYIITEANVLRTLTDMSGICMDFKALIHANINVTSDTTKVNSMFSGCSSLKLVNTAEWDTSRMKDMTGLFRNCKSLTELYLNNFDTSKVTNMYSMFSGCESLIELDLSNFSLISMDEAYYYGGVAAMFSGCKSLKSVQFGEGFDLSKIEDLGSMFSSCHSLKTLDLTCFNVSNVIDMTYMFAYCHSLETLNISNWNIQSSAGLFHMFRECSKLHTLHLDNCNNTTINKIITSDNFPTGTIKDSNDNIIPRRIYCKQTNATGLTPPNGWQFEYID